VQTMAELGQVFFIFCALYGVVSMQQDFEAYCDRRRKKNAARVVGQPREQT
jgi:hypothetical protein